MPNGTQVYDQTQMDIDQAGDTRLQQAIAKKRSLDAINELESKIVKKTADRERQDKEQRLQEKYMVCDSLPEDWTLKTELEISVPLLKEVDDINELLNYKDVQRSLNYFIYMETQLPKFLQENQSKSISLLTIHPLIAKVCLTILL
jgi:hypothetical protein